MSESVHPALLQFWQTHAQPGRVGLIGIRFFLARLVEKGQARLTADRSASKWAHAFIFQQSRDGIPWIYESDMGFMQYGLFRWAPGAQENSILKWSGPRILRACVLDAGLNERQVEKALEHARELIRHGTKYRLRELLGTWIAMRRGHLERESFLHAGTALHCGAFVRACLLAADVDPFGPNIAVSNTAPELLCQKLRPIAYWP
ncbi:MAG: hypothetical protein V1784_05010 [bacterium]